MLRDIERYTGQRIEPDRVPSRPTSRRGARSCSRSGFGTALRRTISDLYLTLVEDLVAEGLEMTESRPPPSGSRKATGRSKWSSRRSSTRFGRAGRHGRGSSRRGP